MMLTNSIQNRGIYAIRWKLVFRILSGFLPTFVSCFLTHHNSPYSSSVCNTCYPYDVKITVPRNNKISIRPKYLSHLKMSSIPISESSETITVNEKMSSKPLWMKCINGVISRTGALNEAVSTLADVTLDEANELIRIGAVWARFDDEESLQRSANEWGYPTMKISNSEEIDGDDIDNYIAKLEYGTAYERLMEPQIINAGIDLRISPPPAVSILL